MKIKIITEPYIRKADTRPLEDLINDFIKDKELIDIKYQISSVGGLLEAFHQVIIMYNDKKETTNKPVIEKVKEEKADLDEKIKKIEAFLNDDKKLSNIKEEQIRLLHCQLETMKIYSKVLCDRVIDLKG